MKKILYLYRNIMPYNIPVLRELVNVGFEVTVIHKFSRRKTSYIPPKINQVTFIDEIELESTDLIKFAINYKPDMAFICDWSIRKFNRCGSFLKNKMNIPVVVGCDTQWTGGKQLLNVISSRFRHHRYFSHILVAGVRQYEYAKKIGFQNEQILMNLYSSDVDKFNDYELTLNQFKENKNFLYVGRFAPEKGIDVLLNAWNRIESKEGYTLTLIGEGPLKDKLTYPDDVHIYSFMNQDELIKHAKSSSCFILPSVFEPWALVIHEFAAAGLPLIVTSACGATPHFVINNYNGIIVPPGSENELKIAIETMLMKDSQELLVFSKRSRMLSEKINPELVANSLISVL